MMGGITNKLRLNQSGMVSIMVVMVLIIVMTLVVLAMSQDSNRQQRQSLDRQLVDQAFYNAESGINDWTNYIYANSSSTGLPNKKTECSTDVGTLTGTGYPAGIPKATINNDSNNQYTCVIYDRTPTKLVYDLKPGDGKTINVKSASGDIQSITLSWTYDKSISSCSALDKNSLVNGSSVAGADFSIYSIESLKRDVISNNAYHAYFLPNCSGLDYNTNFNDGVGVDKQGERLETKCTNGVCSMKVYNINKNNFYVHLGALYSGSSFTLSGLTSVAPVEFLDAQMMLDVTGKSSDVLRRIQVRVPSKGSVYGDIGGYSLRTADSICKLVSVDTQPYDGSGPTASIDNNCL